VRDLSYAESFADSLSFGYTGGMAVWPSARFVSVALIAFGTAVGRSGESQPRPAQRAAISTVVLATRSDSYVSPAFEVKARYARASGLGDASAEARINEALMAPVNFRIASVRRGLQMYPHDDDGVPLDEIAATITLSTPSLVSVRYIPTMGTVLTHSTWSAELTVSVDVKNGRVLGPHELLRPSVFGKAGLKVLGARILAHAPREVDGARSKDVASECFFSPMDPPIELTDESFFARASTGDPYPVPAVQLSLAPHAVDFLIDLVEYDRAYVCRQQTVRVPYAELRPFLMDDVLALLP
jgi:hypothetical protein